MFGLIVLVIIGVIAAVLIRRGASVRLTVIMITSIFIPLSIAFAAWFLAAPPIWTFFAPRLEATIQVADVPDPTGSETVQQRRPAGLDVRVRLDRERSGRLLPLYGAQEPAPGEYSGRIDYQNALRTIYPIGSAITVRYAGDVTYVDEQDWFSTAAFLFCVLFALLALLAVAIISLARPGSRVKPPPT
ncbi:MAG: hypothetical protein Rhims3KO_08290 [Hyphomicrobiales bacterium]